jgi:large subunit ribosomal protein L10
VRDEKKLLARWICSQFDKSDYVFLADFSRITVGDVANLRRELARESGEFHVVKNSILATAARERSLPIPGDALRGQTAIVVGGSNPSGVAKVLKNFREEAKNEKLAVKGGVLNGMELSIVDIDALAELPSIEALRAKLLSLFNAPAQRFVRVLNAVPQSMLNVLQARVDG